MPEIIANTIVAIHVIIITIDCAGAVAVVTNRFKGSRLRRWQQLYFGIAFGKSLSLLFLDSCPLTTAENFFRRQGRIDTAYGNSFVANYLPGLPAEIDLLMTCLLMLAGFIAVLRMANYQIRIFLVALPADSENSTP